MKRISLLGIVFALTWLMISTDKAAASTSANRLAAAMNTFDARIQTITHKNQTTLQQQAVSMLNVCGGSLNTFREDIVSGDLDFPLQEQVGVTYVVYRTRVLMLQYRQANKAMAKAIKPLKFSAREKSLQKVQQELLHVQQRSQEVLASVNYDFCQEMKVWQQQKYAGFPVAFTKTLQTIKSKYAQADIRNSAQLLRTAGVHTKTYQALKRGYLYGASIEQQRLYQQSDQILELLYTT